MKTEYGIVDLFAGPGGLAEGFASIRNGDGSRPFRLVLSVEKDGAAFATLRLRSFIRQFNRALPAEYYSFVSGETREPDWSLLFPKEWKAACDETLRVELGSKNGIQKIDERLDEIVRTHGKNTILIGGPPCQAYSLVGRARNKGKEGYDPSKDSRHFLYKEYIRILQTLMPAVFVMENVKGLLSSSIDGRRVFDQVLDDLAKVGKGSYRLIPLAPRSAQSFFATLNSPASDFVVRSEEFGISISESRLASLPEISRIAKRTLTAALADGASEEF